MRKIAIANRKGGVGKTTTAVNVAAGLALAGNKVLLIDTDTQGHCSRLLGVDPPAGLAELIDGTVTSSNALIEARDGLFLIGGGSKLGGAVKIALKDRYYRSEYLLTEILEPYKEKYNYVIIDTAPGFSEIGINVLFYVSEVLIPVSMEALAIDGLMSFIGEVENIRQHADIEIKYIVPTFIDGRVKKTEDIIEALKERYGNKILYGIHYSVKLSEAPGWGKTIFEYAYNDRTAKDYTRLAGAIA